MIRCKNCGEKIVRFPLKDENGKLIVKNLFKMDLISIIWLAVIIILVITYKADMKQVMEILEDPPKYCEESNACKLIEERNTNPYGVIDIEDIPEINNTRW